MNIFFGRISTETNPQQFIDGFYETNRPQMFNGIEIGDYTYIIANGKIQLWKAKEWVESAINVKRLNFDILAADLSIKIKDLVALKCFELSNQFLVLTARPTVNAFYKINTTRPIDIDEITNLNFYSDENNYRKIVLYEKSSDIIADSEDIQLYFENDSIKIYKAPFFVNGLFDNFYDNRSKIGQGRKKKDTILRKFIKVENFPTTLNHDNISLTNLYDAFGVLYDKEEINDEIEILIPPIETNTSNNTQEYPLNQIFFGPPGTGKTYSTIDAALKIINPDFYTINKNNREELRKEFNKHLIKDWNVAEGRIAFCTFHQSFSYEDFVEGIKPLLESEDASELNFEIKKGLFRLISERAKEYTPNTKTHKSLLNEQNFEQKNFYKISLGDANNSNDNNIYNYAIENDLIAIGFLNDDDLKGKSKDELKDIAQKNDETKYAWSAMDTFINKIKIDDYVLVSNGNHKIRAIGQVKGAYIYQSDIPIKYKHTRKVEWLYKNDIDIPINEIYEKVLSQQTIYQFDKPGLKKEFFVNNKSNSIDENLTSNFVLIIDEINRGNVSQIFGELITLIEDNKRLGKGEALEVMLPYSKEKLGVPPNLYIIGTMNTADRSVEALDTALRRRFSFVEMPPKYDLQALQTEILSYKLQDILQIINKRIEKLLNKDNLIGHSYFLSIESPEKLQSVFQDKIIPLLQEYFFGDYGKIGLILGNGFVEKEENREDIFYNFEYNDGVSDFTQRPIYRIKNVIDMTTEQFKLALDKLLKRKNNEQA